MLNFLGSVVPAADSASSFPEGHPHRPGCRRRPSRCSRRRSSRRGSKYRFISSKWSKPKGRQQSVASSPARRRMAAARRRCQVAASCAPVSEARKISSSSMGLNTQPYTPSVAQISSPFGGSVTERRWSRTGRSALTHRLSGASQRRRSSSSIGRTSHRPGCKGAALFSSST